MILFQYCLVLLLASALAQALAPKLKVPVELLLLLGSIGVSLVPGVPYVTLPSDIIFFVFLPPILFAAAYFTSLGDFLKNIRPIFFLAVGLVVVTTLAIGYGIHYVAPEIPLTVAMLLGAIVSPPDAAAAAAFAKQLHLPRRVVTILEGESLLNDATALVAFRFALAATLSGTFSISEAAGSFFILSIGGAFIGFITGWICFRFIMFIKHPTAESLVSFVTAFLAYLIAEKLHLSGVVSTVVAGIYFGRKISTLKNAQSRIEAQGAWNVVLMAINGIIFTIMGLQLPTVIGTVVFSDTTLAVRSLFITLAILVGVRFIWIFSVSYLSRELIPSVKKSDPHPSWKNLLILSWSGMRGIVTLATVIAIPEVLPNGKPFPYRDILFLVSYGVILASIIIPSLTLPKLVQWLQLPKENHAEKEESLARLHMARKVIDGLNDMIEIKGSNFHSKMVDRYQSLMQRIEANFSDDASYSTLCDYEQLERRGIKKILSAERKALHELRKERKIHDEVFHELELELDIEELRLRKNVRPMY